MSVDALSRTKTSVLLQSCVATCSLVGFLTSYAAPAPSTSAWAIVGVPVPAMHCADEAHKVTGSNGMSSKKTITTRDTVSQTSAQTATLSGEQTVLQAGNNIAITGSNVVSTSGTLLSAGNDIKVQAATWMEGEIYRPSI